MKDPLDLSIEVSPRKGGGIRGFRFGVWVENPLRSWLATGWGEESS
jgi:hypothetical protein